MTSTTGHGMSKSAGNPTFDRKLIDVRTRSVEKALEPLIIQVCQFFPMKHILSKEFNFLQQ